MSCGLLIETPRLTTHLDVPAGRSTVLGRSGPGAVAIDDPAVTQPAVSLLPSADGVQLEVLSGGGPVWLNDVQIRTSATAHLGDEIRFANTRVVICHLSRRGLATHRQVLTYDAYWERVCDGVARAERARPVVLALALLPPLNATARAALVRRLTENRPNDGDPPVLGEYAHDVLGVFWPSLNGREARDVAAALAAVAGPRVKVEYRKVPDDGYHAPSLMLELVDSLFPRGGPLEPEFADALSARLFEAASRLVARAAPFVVTGPSGSGRATLARAALARDASTPVEVLAGWLPGLEARLRALKDDRRVLIRRIDLAADPPALIRQLSQRRAPWAATADELGGLPGPGNSLRIPPLAARPGAATELARAMVIDVRSRFGRPRLTLAPEVERSLEIWPWPGDVAELGAALARAGRAALGDEIGLDVMPAAMGGPAEREDLRHSLKAAERDLLLEALAKTRWNVTRAAVRLGLPRRTVVYRMARLGLKRPTR